MDFNAVILNKFGAIKVTGDTIGFHNHTDLDLKDKDDVVHELGPSGYGRNGITLRTQTNPSNGEAIFAVESSGNSPRLLVEHNGAVKTSNTDMYVGVGADGTGGYRVHHADNVGKGVYTYRTSNRTQVCATAVPFTSEFRDDAGFHNNSTNNTRLTVPSGEAGWYSIFGRVNAANNSSITYLQAYIVHSSGKTLSANFAERSNNSGGINAAVACCYYLVAGEYVELYSNAGGVGSFIVQGTSGAYYTMFGMVKISTA